MVKPNLGGNRGAKPDSLIRIGQVAATIFMSGEGIFRAIFGRVEKIDNSGKPTVAVIDGTLSDNCCGGRGTENYNVSMPLNRLIPVMEMLEETLKQQRLLPHDAFYDFAVRLNVADAWRLSDKTLLKIAADIFPIHHSREIDVEDVKDDEMVWKITSGMEVGKGLAHWSKQVDDRIAELRDHGVSERLLMVVEDMLALGVDTIIFSHDHEDAFDSVEPA